LIKEGLHGRLEQLVQTVVLLDELERNADKKKLLELMARCRVSDFKSRRAKLASETNLNGSLTLRVHYTPGIRISGGN
jgi:hypothetical protein